MAGTIQNEHLLNQGVVATMPITVKCTNRFLARSESGEECYINEYTEYAVAEDRSGHHLVPGMKYLETDDGNKLNYEDKGRYELVATGEIFVSDAPDAP